MCQARPNNLFHPKADKITFRDDSKDLHTEYYDDNAGLPEVLIVPLAPVLALPGDIGYACDHQLKEHLSLQVDRFKTGLFVAGKNEFYNNKSNYLVSEQPQWMRDVCNECAMNETICIF